MNDNDKVLREIYISDILRDAEEKMLYGVDDSWFDKMDDLHNRVEDDHLYLKDYELNELEKAFNNFYFEYGYIQFKRGIELGLSMHHIH